MLQTVLTLVLLQLETYQVPHWITVYRLINQQTETPVATQPYAGFLLFDLGAEVPDPYTFCKLCGVLEAYA